MARVTVLGGCGVVGGVVVRTLAKTLDFDTIIIGDYNKEKADKMATELGEKVVARFCDANDVSSIKNTIKDSDIVVNCIGPYYKYEKPILSAVIDEKKNYVDVCDDTEPTYQALEMDDAAKEAGITALIGMGSSPGVTNMLASYAANDLLEQCDSIDMFHTHGGEPNEGAAVIGHRFYCMSNPIPVFLDGKAMKINPDESKQLEEDVEFINLEGKHRVYPYPHPEPITLPMYIKGVKRVTNKGNVLPKEYYDLTRQIHKCGLSSKEPVIVGGKEVIPHEFAIAYLIQQRDKILEEVSFGEPRGCVKIVVKGKKKGTEEGRTYVFSLVSEGAGKGGGLGEATGIPAAFGAILMQRGKISRKGVVPPEACVNPMDFISTMKEVLEVSDSDSSKRSPIIFQSIDDEGNVKTLKF